MFPRVFTWAVILIGVVLISDAFAGRIEDARSRFNEVQARYAETKRYLDDKNTNAAKPAAKTLLQVMTSTCTAITGVEDGMSDVPTLLELWTKARRACVALNTSAAILELKIGEGDASRELAKVTEEFDALGNSMAVAQQKSKEFGVKWQVLCDSACR
jgi:hypothetical protein